MFKKILSWFIDIIKETLNLSWTLVGLVIATLTLTGSAQQVTGLATLITLGVWLLTINFRKDKAKKRSDASDKAFHANPTVKGVLKSRKANKRTSAIAKSGMKLVEHKKKFSKKPYGSEKGYN